LDKKEVVLFDFDDTLIDTNLVFRNQVAAFFDFAASNIPNLDTSGFERRFRELENIAFDLIGVSDSHWHYIIDALVQEHGDSIQNGVTIFDEIYTSVPNIFDGVKETLEVCRSAGLRIGLVTHAGSDWTKLKIEGHGLQDYFEEVISIDPKIYKHKGSEHWRDAIQIFNVDPKHTLVVGDSLNGDVNAARNAGVQKLVWILNQWNKSVIGDLPDDVHKIDKIGDLVEALAGVKS
jgi:putative hydrolase of the HAD superfamily